MSLPMILGILALGEAVAGNLTSNRRSQKRDMRAAKSTISDSSPAAVGKLTLWKSQHPRQKADHLAFFIGVAR